MQFCTYCNSEFYCSVIEHCDSGEHRQNVINDSKKSVGYSVEDFKKHYEAMSSITQAMIQDYKKDDPFWEAAKKSLNEEDYNILKENIIGGKTDRKLARNFRHRRFSRNR